MTEQEETTPAKYDVFYDPESEVYDVWPWQFEPGLSKEEADLFCAAPDMLEALEMDCARRCMDRR